MGNGKSKALLLDTNVFVEAHKRYYAQDICPGFWSCLLRHCNKGSVRSIDKVKEEIKTGKDELWDWVQSAPPDLFATSNEQSVQDAFSEIMEWVRNQQFSNDAQTGFAKGADGWLAAYARVHGMTLVSDEKPNPNIKRRVPIPNVCARFNISYENTFSMLRGLGAQFK